MKSTEGIKVKVSLPMTIKSNSIGEGYVPVVFSKSENIVGIVGYSTLEIFAISIIETSLFLTS